LSGRGGRCWNWLVQQRAVRDAPESEFTHGAEPTVRGTIRLLDMALVTEKLLYQSVRVLASSGVHACTGGRLHPALCRLCSAASWHAKDGQSYLAGWTWASVTPVIEGILWRALSRTLWVGHMRSPLNWFGSQSSQPADVPTCAPTIRGLALQLGGSDEGEARMASPRALDHEFVLSSRCRRPRGSTRDA
jgi:hypothetical protein